MLLRSINLIFLAATTVFHATVAQDPATQLQQLQAAHAAQAMQSLSSGGGGGRCTPQNVIVRREWGDMSPAQRQDFIRACHCLKNLPPRTNPRTAPGATSRHDDFVVAHILNSMKWHLSPWLLIAHRYFGWQMEQALRNECGYQGGLPYWAWERYAGLPMGQSPTFDGSPTSLSGTGRQTPMTQGCSCVIEGPFAGWTCSLGPTGGGIGCKQNPRPDGLGKNTRCLERGFHQGNMVNQTYSNMANVIYNSPDATAFGIAIDDWSGLHANPHTAIGGLQMDIPGAPCDPAFFLHHCNLDRMYTFWQSLDFPNRRNELGSADPYQRLRRIKNWPPAVGISPEDMIHLSQAFPDLRVSDAMSTTAGPFCYIYE